MKRCVKYGLVFLALILIGYNSLYFKKLSDVSNKADSKFDAVAFVESIWEKELPAKLDSAIDINSLMQLVKTNPKEAFSRYTHALAIGNNRYALIKGMATVNSVNDDNIEITIDSDHPFVAMLATEFIYGNTLRDASGLVNLKDFSNTADLNNISKELNKIVRSKVVPAFKPLLRSKMKINFIGAIELNKEHIHFEDMEIVPVSIKIAP